MVHIRHTANLADKDAHSVADCFRAQNVRRAPLRVPACGTLLNIQVPPVNIVILRLQVLDNGVLVLKLLPDSLGLCLNLGASCGNVPPGVDCVFQRVLGLGFRQFGPLLQFLRDPLMVCQFGLQGFQLFLILRLGVVCGLPRGALGHLRRVHLLGGDGFPCFFLFFLPGLAHFFFQFPDAHFGNVLLFQKFLPFLVSHGEHGPQFALAQLRLVGIQSVCFVARDTVLRSAHVKARVCCHPFQPLSMFDQRLCLPQHAAQL